MTEIRSNSVTGATEIKHPNLDIWVQAVVPLLIAGGWKVSLAEAQAIFLETLKSNSDSIPDIATQIAGVRDDFAAVRLVVDELNQLKLQTIVEAIEESSTAIETNSTTVSDISNRFQAIETTLRVCKDHLQACSNNLSVSNLTLSSVLASISSNTQLLKTAIDRQTANIPNLISKILATANAQYSVSFPAGTKRLAIKCRGSSGDPLSLLKVSWTHNAVLGNQDYDVVDVGMEFYEEGFYLSADTSLYVAAPVSGAVITVRYWT